MTTTPTSRTAATSPHPSSLLSSTPPVPPLPPDRPLAERFGGSLPVLALLGVTAAWGSTFFMIKDLLDRVPATDFLVVRFAIATVAVALIAPRAVFRLSPLARRRGLILGAIYGAAQVLQTVGLGHTTASTSGFITGMYVVCTPLLAAILLGQRIRRRVGFAVVLATGGLGLLTLRSLSDGLEFGFGELLTLGSAVLYALHIVGLGAWTKARDTLGLAVVQMAAVTAVCALVAVPSGPVVGGLVLPQAGSDLAAVLYMALVAGAGAMIAQTWAQAHLSSTRAAVIMCMEPVWASVFAIMLGGETPTVRLVLGGGFILTAMYITELRGTGDSAEPTSPFPGPDSG